MARARKVPRTQGNIFVISAPSGAGKTTLVNRLLASVPGLTFSVSHTTREPRTGEKDGRDYFFVTPGKFRRMIGRGDLLIAAITLANRATLVSRNLKDY